MKKLQTSTVGEKSSDVITLPVGAMATNCYLVRDGKTLETIIIDPGEDASYIAESLERHACIPVAICATHGHFDHILGVWELMKHYTIPFYLHPKDRFLLPRMKASAGKYLGRPIVEPIPTVTDDLYEGRRILFGTSFLTTVETPGHTPGSVGFILSDQPAYLSGDTLFADGGIGDWHHSYSDKKALDASVRNILSFPIDIRLFPGHGRMTTVEEARLLVRHG